LRGPLGDGDPKIGDASIAFNGDKANDLDHESFIFNRDLGNRSPPYDSKYGWFNCCKTARKPYDLVVCVVLLLAKHYFPDITIKSDGCAPDWAPAVAWYRDLFGDSVPAGGPWEEGDE
jgi:hypothetical protein